VRRALVAALVALAVAGAAFVVAVARSDTTPTAAPSDEEGVTFERSILRPGRIVLVITNDGGEPVRVAQVMVNDAFVDFGATATEISAHRSARLTIGYPWVAGESYEIGVLTSDGAIAEYELEDAAGA
jgi:zinc transporter, ZIP family